MNLILCIKGWSNGLKVTLWGRRMPTLPPDLKVCGEWSATHSENLPGKQHFQGRARFEYRQEMKKNILMMRSREAKNPFAMALGDHAKIRIKGIRKSWIERAITRLIHILVNSLCRGARHGGLSGPNGLLVVVSRCWERGGEEGTCLVFSWRSLDCTGLTDLWGIPNPSEQAGMGIN